MKYREVPEEALEVLIASLTESSITQYGSGFKLWWEFCTKKNLNCFETNADNVLQFLALLFHSGMSYSSLNTVRSAVALVAAPDIGQDYQIKRFFRGVFKLRPSKPRYRVTWDPCTVLSHLRTYPPNEQLDIKRLTYKLITLMALVTAHRVQTFSLIEVQDIRNLGDKIEIKIPARVKTSSPNNLQPMLLLPFCREDPQLCVASTLCHYVEKTEEARRSRGIDKLLITFKRPYKAATTQSLSRWIRSVLEESGIDTSIFTAHSTRHAATSAAARRGVSIEIIRNTAGWTSSSQVFANFYNRPLASSEGFGDAILANSHPK